MVKSGKRDRGETDKYDSDDGFIEKDVTAAKKRKSGSEENKYWEVSSSYNKHGLNFKIPCRTDIIRQAASTN